ncbi:hypothetical protein DVH24_042399 [Malus domestica]|uniref:Uncharacterized protein n=1 Tax=Malus domestica TaxID=3750 RepID=A0A498IYD1_MALDO|nr:hypothetical protein DVH24_042399 [Malus domestica]
MTDYQTVNLLLSAIKQALSNNRSLIQNKQGNCKSSDQHTYKGRSALSLRFIFLNFTERLLVNVLAILHFHVIKDIFFEPVKQIVHSCFPELGCQNRLSHSPYISGKYGSPCLFIKATVSMLYIRVPIIFENFKALQILSGLEMPHITSKTISLSLSPTTSQMQSGSWLFMLPIVVRTILPPGTSSSARDLKNTVKSFLNCSTYNLYTAYGLVFAIHMFFLFSPSPSLNPGNDLNTVLKSFPGRSFKKAWSEGDGRFSFWKVAWMLCMISDTAKRVLGPEEHPKSAIFKQSEKSVLQSCSMLALTMGFTIEITAL